VTTSPFELAPLVLLTVALAVIAAGCSGGSKSPGVASLGAAAATTTTASSAPTGPLGGEATGATFGLKTGDARKFASCMRSHGVPNFPEPNSQGAIEITPSSGVDPGSSAFQSAQQHCRSLLPNGGRPSPQEQARMRAAALAFSACMRKHGVTSFPDPTFSGGGARIKITGGAGTLDPQSPVFKSALQACNGKLPGRLATGSAGGK